MKTFQEKKSSTIIVLSRYQNEFQELIERLEMISNEEDYDNFLKELYFLLAKTNNSLLSEIQFCQNYNAPDEIQKINID